MPGIDESRPFHPLNIAVLTVSDTRTKEDDSSGDRLQEMMTKAGHKCVARNIVRDDKQKVRQIVMQHINDEGVDVVITTGGTGLTGRDITVEAVTPLFDKTIEGFSVLMHMLSYKTVGTSTLASRACAGLAKNTLIFCLPGSPGACKDGWKGIIEPQLDSRHGPCNLVALMERFLEK